MCGVAIATTVVAIATTVVAIATMISNWVLPIHRKFSREIFIIA